jgi:hypothetical protein
VLKRHIASTGIGYTEHITVLTQEK